jgi:serine phosphatase RsbU (regulator of sigma subunit)
VLLYTDGVTEAGNQFGEEFGLQRLSEVLRRGSLLSAQDLVNDVYNTAADFCDDEFNDDVTIVVVKCMFDDSPLTS